LTEKPGGGYSKGTFYFDRMKLQLFLRFCELQQVSEISQITPVFIRTYLLHLENTNHNPGGVHACYRALKTFMKWYQLENDLNDRNNPIDKAKVRNPRKQPLELANIEAVKAILETCKNTFADKRDRIIILMLLDTGMRISELLFLEHENINPITGVVQILHGKGGKFRTVYISRKTRLALRKYLKVTNKAGRLFLTTHGEPAIYSTVRIMFRRRSEIANVDPPTPHQFRRLFALTMLRNGVDIYSL